MSSRSKHDPLAAPSIRRPVATPDPNGALPSNANRSAARAEASASNSSRAYVAPARAPNQPARLDRGSALDAPDKFAQAVASIMNIDEALSNDRDDDVDIDGDGHANDEEAAGSIKASNPCKLQVFNIPTAAANGIRTPVAAITELLRAAKVSLALLHIDPVPLFDDAVFISVAVEARLPASEATYMRAVKRVLSNSMKTIWAPFLDKDGLRGVSIDISGIRDESLVQDLKKLVRKVLEERDVTVTRCWSPAGGGRIIAYLLYREDIQDTEKMKPIVHDNRTLVLRPPNMRTIVLPCAPFHLVIGLARGNISRMGVPLKRYIQSFQGVNKVWFDRINDRVHFTMESMSSASNLQESWDFENNPLASKRQQNTEMVGPEFASHYNSLPYRLKVLGADAQGLTQDRWEQSIASLRTELEDVRQASRSDCREMMLDFSATIQRQMQAQMELMAGTMSNFLERIGHSLLQAQISLSSPPVIGFGSPSAIVARENRAKRVAGESDRSESNISVEDSPSQEFADLSLGDKASKAEHKTRDEKLTRKGHSIRPLSHAFLSRFCLARSLCIIALCFFMISPAIVEAAARSTPRTPAQAVTAVLTGACINLSGMRNRMKIHETKRFIANEMPHFFVITETMSVNAANEGWPGYQVRECKGISTRAGTLQRGVMLAVRQDIPIISKHVDNPEFQGRVVYADIVLPHRDRHKKIRLVGEYSPSITNGNNTVEDYGEHNSRITELVSAPLIDGWVRIGDVNATLHSDEYRNSPTGALEGRAHYRNFLIENNGVDLWESLRPERTVASDWTSSAWGSTDGGSIIDRSSCSIASLSPKSIKVNSHFVPATNHRWVTIAVKLTGSTVAVGSWKTAKMSSDHLNEMIGRRCKNCSDPGTLDIFSQEVDEGIHTYLGRDSNLVPISTPAEWDERYKSLSECVTSAASRNFGKRHVRRGPCQVFSPTINGLLADIRALGRMKRAADQGELHSRSQDWPFRRWVVKLRYEAQINNTTFANFVRKIKTCKLRELRKATAAKLEELFRNKIKADLASVMSGRVGHFNGAKVDLALPAAVHRPDGSLAMQPEEVKEAYRDFWQRLYDHSHDSGRGNSSTTYKPWLRCAAAEKFRRASMPAIDQDLPEMTLEDLKKLLKKGKRAPSPGPDGMEKWYCNHFSDLALTELLNLANFIIRKKYFSEKANSVIQFSIYKKGALTDLSNYRGLMLSNLVINISNAWMTQILQDLADRFGMLPPHQIAARPGVQGRDLTSMLSSIICSARRNNETLLALSRDQQKGFDFLNVEAFYDAIDFFGLPEDFAEYDRASQSRICCAVQTPYGAVNVVIRNILKQGDSRSPIRYCLSMAVGMHWLRDLVMMDQRLREEVVVIRSREPHVEFAKVEIPILSVECMDDSIILARGKRLLSFTAIKLEMFQNRYGARTSWTKSSYHVCNAEDFGAESLRALIQFSFRTEESHFQLASEGDLKFLRTTIDDTDTRFSEVKTIAEAYILPKARDNNTLPFLAITKIVNGTLIARIAARLRLQPIQLKQAQKIDSIIARKFNKYYHFHPIISSKNLTSKLIGIQSIERANSSISVQGVLRDLNHQIGSLRLLAQHSLAEWGCKYNKCRNPFLSKNGLIIQSQVPSHMQTAAKAIKQLNASANRRLGIVNTDQSEIYFARSHEKHLSNLAGGSRPQGSTSGDIASVRAKIQASMRSACSVKECLRSAANPLSKLVEGPVEFGLPRRDRQIMHNRSIKRQADLRLPSLPSGPSRPLDGPQVVATDGSKSSCGELHGANIMCDSAHSPCPRRSITCRVERRATFNHSGIAELSAIGLALVTADNMRPLKILTDYMPAIIRLERMRRTPSKTWPTTDRSWYNWILDLVREFPLGVEFQHVKAHTSAADWPARLNADADLLAKELGSTGSKVLDNSEDPITLDCPTFKCEKWVLFELNSGSPVESNTYRFCMALQNEENNARLSLNRNPLYQQPFEFCAQGRRHEYLSDYAQKVRAQLRCNVFPCHERMARIFRDSYTRHCKMCGSTWETTHHIFVSCPAYSHIRKAMSEALRKRLEKWMPEDSPDRPAYMDLAIRGFEDCAVWPAKHSRFYLGVVPKWERAGEARTFRTAGVIASRYFSKTASWIAGHRWRRLNVLVTAAATETPAGPAGLVDRAGLELVHSGVWEDATVE